MSRWLLIAATLLVAVTVLWPTSGQADGCKNQKWCFEAERFAFRITDNEVTIDMLRRLDTVGDTGVLIEYLLHHRSRMYMGWLRPTPEMHGVTCSWNVGLQLKSGETIWAEKWFVGRQHGEGVQYDSTDTKHFTPGVDEESQNRKSFIVVLTFPKEKQDGKEWKNSQIEGLAVRQRD